MKPDILFLEDSSTVLPILPLLEPHFTVHKLAEGDGPEAIPAHLAARILGMVATTNRGVEDGLIEALPRLEIIAVPGGHLHAFPRESLRRRGIRLTNAPGVSADDVADLIFGLMIAAARRVSEGDRFVRAGRWPAGDFPFGIKVSGKNLGIVGLGRIGRLVGRRAEGFDMDVHYHEPQAFADVAYRFWPDLLGMAGAVDFLVVTCPSAPETRRIIGKGVLEALGPEGILVNVVRGCVDEAALAEALAAGTVGGAGLDVFETEPRVPASLAAADRLVLSPHVAWKSREGRNRFAELAADNLRAHFAGDPLLTPVI